MKIEPPFCSVVFNNSDGDPVARYELHGEADNDHQAWVALLRWAIVHRPEATAEALDVLVELADGN